MLEIVVPLVFILSAIVLVIMGIGSAGAHEEEKKKDAHGHDDHGPSSGGGSSQSPLDKYLPRAASDQLADDLDPFIKGVTNAVQPLGKHWGKKLGDNVDDYLHHKKDNRLVREMPRIPGPVLGKDLHHDRIAHDIFEVYKEAKEKVLGDQERATYTSLVYGAASQFGSNVPRSLVQALDLLQNANFPVRKEEVYRVIAGESKYHSGVLAKDPTFTTSRLAYERTTARDDLKIFKGMELPTKERSDMSPVGTPEKLLPKRTPPFIEKRNMPVQAHYSVLNDEHGVYSTIAEDLTEGMVESLRRKYEAQKVHPNSHYLSHELFHYIKHGEEHAHDLPSREKLRDQRIYAAIDATMRQYASEHHIHGYLPEKEVLVDTAMAGTIASGIDVVLRKENNGVGIGTKKKGGH